MIEAKTAARKKAWADYTTAAKGWTHQVQWIEGGNPCFVRCTSGREADVRADKLVKQGQKPVVIDLHDALQLH